MHSKLGNTSFRLSSDRRGRSFQSDAPTASQRAPRPAMVLESRASEMSAASTGQGAERSKRGVHAHQTRKHSIAVLRRASQFAASSKPSDDPILENAAAIIMQRAIKSKWTQLRNVQKGRALLTRSRYRIRARKNAAKEFEEQVAENVDGAFWEQGDRDMHSVSKWEQRMLLRKHPLVMTVLRRWCGVVRIPVTYPSYVELSIRLYKALVPDFDLEEAREVAEEEFLDEMKAAASNGLAEDRGTESLMPAGVFMDSIFELADHCARPPACPPAARS